MAEHGGDREADFSLHHVEIGVADAAGADPEQHLADPRLGRGDLLDRERSPDRGQDGSLHENLLIFPGGLPQPR